MFLKEIHPMTTHLHLQNLADALIQNDLHSFHFIYTTKQWRIKDFAEGPRSGSLEALGYGDWEPSNQ